MCSICVCLCEFGSWSDLCLILHAFLNSCNQIFSFYSLLKASRPLYPCGTLRLLIAARWLSWLTASFLTSCASDFSYSCAFARCLDVCRRLGTFGSAEGNASACAHSYPAVRSGHRIALVGLARHRFSSCA